MKVWLPGPGPDRGPQGQIRLAVSDSLARIEKIKDYEVLNSLIPKAVLATSPEDFARKLDALKK